MQGRQLSGPGAGAQKYDLLTALGTFALAADRSTQRRALRLITLITARYNWRAGELTVGRREIARLWSVDERTVKREIGALKAMGFLSVKRPGVRGRVTAYRVELDAILKASQPDWDRVGPDFADRMGAMAGQGAETPERTIIPFPNNDPNDTSEWARAKAVLRAADPARFKAWFAPLAREGVGGGVLVLRAPSEFHARYIETHFCGEIMRALQQVAPEVNSLSILAQR